MVTELLNLDEFDSISNVVEREIDFKIGHDKYERKVFVKLFSGQEAHNLLADGGSFEPHKTIFAGIVNSDGSKKFQDIQAVWKLKSGLHTALHNAVVLTNLGIESDEDQGGKKDESLNSKIESGEN